MFELHEPDKKQVASGIKGWGAANTQLKKVKDEPRRDLLTACVRNCGLQGAPALGYFARVLRWAADEAPAPVPPKELTLAEMRLVEDRAKAMLKPYVDVKDYRLPRKTGAGALGQAA